MTLEQLNVILLTHRFVFADGITYYEFFHNGTIRVSGNVTNQIKHSIVERNDRFYLDHEKQIATENFYIEIDNTKNPITLTLTHELSQKVWTLLGEPKLL